MGLREIASLGEVSQLFGRDVERLVTALRTKGVEPSAFAAPTGSTRTIRYGDDQVAPLSSAYVPGETLILRFDGEVMRVVRREPPIGNRRARRAAMRSR